MLRPLSEFARVLRMPLLPSSLLPRSGSRGANLPYILLDYYFGNKSNIKSNNVNSLAFTVGYRVLLRFCYYF